MENSSHLYISEFGDNEDMEMVEVEEEEDDDDDDDDEEEEMEDSHHEETGMEPVSPDLHQDPEQLTNRRWDSFPCQHCDRQFTSESDLERHSHVHAVDNSEAHAYKCSNSITSFGSETSHRQNEQAKLLDSPASDMKLHPEDHAALPDKRGISEEHHVCKYCEKMFSTYTSKRQHELKIHEQHLRDHCVEQFHLPQEEHVHGIIRATSQPELQLAGNAAPAAVLVNEGEHLKRYMLDVSSSVSENLSFYMDGKIVSTSTVSSCEAAEVHCGSSTSVGLDALIFDPAQICQVLNADSATGREIPGQPLAKRRTATPPLLPQIKTELESEVVVSSSSSSLVSSLIENLLPQNTESTVVQTERTVFLSPKLKRLLEKQDGLKPTLALIADGQTPRSPVSLSVLPAGTGKFKRRTGSPPSSPQQNQTSNEETPAADAGDCDAQTDTQHSSPSQNVSNETDDGTPSVEEPVTSRASSEPWSLMIGGNSCNQQPLDLSNAVKSAEDGAAADAVLDLSLQRKSPDRSRFTLTSDSRAPLEAGRSNACVLETPVVSDVTVVSAPVDPVADALVYGLALPANSLTPPSASLTPVALQPAPPCAIAFASPASHAVLPAAPPLITVLAPPPSLSNSPRQPLHVLAPNISPEPLVICAENALNSPECDLSAAFTAANAANLITLSRPLDPTLNLPGRVFLSDQIALSAPIVESTAGSDVPFTPTVTLNDSLLNSFNLTSNTVLIECTIALEAPASVVPAAVTRQENAAEPPAPAQMVANHIEQQQIVSAPNPQNVDPPVLASSIAEPVSLSPSSSSPSSSSSSSSVIPDTAAESSPAPQPVSAEAPITKEEEPAAESSVSHPEISAKTPPPCEKAEENPSNDTDDDSQQQTFTKNFVCNVCEKLFHSMKELGHHVRDHAADWPYKCEFCVLLFGKPSALLDHRSSLHGVGKTYVCSVCTKEFVYLCNLKQHQEEVHPGHQCTYTEEEKGKLRPQNYNSSIKVKVEASLPDTPEEPKRSVKKEEGAAEELLTTMKIMALEGGKRKGPDVRLGINQHYPSFKPPPFPYHNRSPAGSVASATNFTTRNIPQTFTTAIRCTKCGKSFDNMPELHKHVLACANASDKRRYTPKKNPIPLRHFAKPQNGVLSTTNSTNGLNAPHRASQANRPKAHQDPPVKMKLKVLSKKKKKLVQRTMSQRSKSAPSSNKGSPAHVDQEQEIFVCPHCSREFTLRRCRTKHVAVCPKKPKDVKKSKDGGTFVTKENNGHLQRGSSHAEDKQGRGRHKTRLQTSAPAKRHAILPVQTVLSGKRSKIIIKEPKREAPTLSDLPVVRTFNPSMRQYSRAQHGVREAPVKLTVVKQAQSDAQRDELRPARSQDAAGGVTGGSQQSATA